MYMSNLNIKSLYMGLLSIFILISCSAEAYKAFDGLWLIDAQKTTEACLNSSNSDDLSNNNRPIYNFFNKALESVTKLGCYEPTVHFLKIEDFSFSNRTFGVPYECRYIPRDSSTVNGDLVCNITPSDGNNARNPFSFEEDLITGLSGKIYLEDEYLIWEPESDIAMYFKKY